MGGLSATGKRTLGLLHVQLVQSASVCGVFPVQEVYDEVHKHGALCKLEVRRAETLN